MEIVKRNYDFTHRAETVSYIVYKHTSPTNKVYIGITHQTTSRRWRNGDGYTYNQHFYNAIQKYGWDNFEHEILFDSLTKEEACQKEIELIDYYKSNQKEFGYNISTGGECGAVGVKCPEEKRKYMSELFSGRGNPFYNCTHSDRTILKIKESRKGKRWDYFKGKHHTEDSKRKLSESHKGLFDNGKSVLCKKVCQYSLTGEMIKTYVSLTNACEELNISKGWLSEIINKNKTYKNCKFTYTEV